MITFEPPTAPPTEPPFGPPAPPVEPPTAETPPPSPSKRPYGRIAAGVVAALAIGSAGFTAGRTTTPEPAVGTPVTTSATVSPARAPVSGDEPAAAAAAAVASAVVQLETSDGLGSGVLYDAEGHILTAAHVIAGASTLTVRLADGTTVEGRVVGADSATDVGVVAIDPPAGITPATLALDEPLVVGQIAVAIGSPFGLDQTVTSGIVSAVDRSVDGMTVVQTDAAINHGNSGGPLVDATGRVIGINSAIYSESGDNAGIGFAVPIDVAHRVASQLIAGTDVQVARLGVSTTDPVSGRGGALVQEVVAGSAAEAAGIQVGDLITSVDGGAVSSSSRLQAQVLKHAPGDRVEVEVVRNGRTLALDATLGAAGR